MRWRPPRRTPLVAGHHLSNGMYKGAAAGQDRTRLAIRCKMVIVRPESSHTCVNT
jgi:hypothetical protein